MGFSFKLQQVRLSKIIIEVSNLDLDDKEELLRILHNWKNGNFKNCVSEHNYVWDMFERRSWLGKWP